MLRHRLKTGDLTSRSERNAALIRTLSETFRDRHKEYTNLRILAADEGTVSLNVGNDVTVCVSSFCTAALAHPKSFGVAPFYGGNYPPSSIIGSLKSSRSIQ